jgi:hypothetical protein
LRRTLAGLALIETDPKTEIQENADPSATLILPDPAGGSHARRRNCDEMTGNRASFLSVS